MSKEETIHIEEETTNGQPTWSEEFNVTSKEIINFLNNIVQEASVRRVIIKNEKRNIHWDIPILMGVGAIALLPTYAALGLIVALVADFQITVERAVVETEKEA